MGTIIELFSQFGRRNKFEALLAPHIGQLYRQAYRFTGNQNDAEDLIQDLFLQLYPRRDEIGRIEHLRAWLVKALYHRFIDNIRHRSHDPLLSSDCDDALDTVVDTEDCPDRHAENALLQKRLSFALKQLNPEQRAVVVLHDMEGHTLEELHTMLDIPTGTLKSRLHRARRQLRIVLKMEPLRSELHLADIGS